MIEFLFAVGTVVFFISVYGAVMVGGHLLGELQAEDVPEQSASGQQRRVGGSASRGRGPDGYGVEASK